jgi:predicted MFS family arabinose efflux permease
VPEPASRRPARPLTVPGVRAVVLVVLVSTAGLAAFEVAVTGIAARTHQPAATGVLFALWLAGSLLGGWLYGRRSWSMRLDVQLAALLAVCGVTALAPLLANDLLAVAPLLVVAGLAIAPATSVQFAIMSAVAPGRSRTEAFTWASTASFLGVAGGSWLCGAAVQSRGPSAGILLAGLLALLAAGVALMNRRALSPVPGLRALHERTGAVVAESYLAPVRGFLEPTDSPHFGTPTQRTPQTAGVAGHPSAVAET